MDKETERIFLEEASGLIEGLKSGVLSFKREAPEYNEEGFKELIMNSHNLKGICRMVGMEDAGVIAQHMETIFEALSKGTLRSVSGVLDPMLKALDVLGDLVKDIDKGGGIDGERVLSVSRRLERFMEGLGEPHKDDEDEIEPPNHGVSTPEEEEGAKEGEFYKELLNAFVEEGNELLDKLETDLTLLEDEPVLKKDLLEDIFRTAHSLKSGFNSVGLTISGSLAHTMEDIFEQFRQEKVESGPALMDALLESVDRLRSNLMSAAKGERKEDDVSSFIDRLGCLTKGPVTDKYIGQMHSVMGKTDGKSMHTPKALSRAVSTLRVDIGRLDEVMNLMGEIVINKGYLDRRLGNIIQILDGIGDLKRLLDKLRRRTTKRGVMGKGGIIQERISNKGIRAETVIDEIEDKLQRILPAMTGIEELSDDIRKTGEQMARNIGGLQRSLMSTRMVPIVTVFNKFPRVVRDLARERHKEVYLEIKGEETELDKTIVDEIGDPLIHMVRNAIDHGIEYPDDRERKGKPRDGLLYLNAYHQGDSIIIEVEDDGCGMDADKLKEVALKNGIINQTQAEMMDRQEALDLIFTPGFSSSEEVTDISGRGVGMDVVKNNISRLKGTVGIETEKGVGTRFIVRLPLTLAIIDSLLIKVASQIYTIPLNTVEETIFVDNEEIKRVGKREVINLRGRVVPLIRLGELLGLEHEVPYGRLPVVVVESNERRMGLLIDEMVGKQEIVMKTMGDLLFKVKHISGGMIMGDGRVIPILDIPSIIESASTLGEYGEAFRVQEPQRRETTPVKRPKILVVDDSQALRSFFKKAIEGIGCMVREAGDGVEGMALIEEEMFDLIITDIMMPNMDGYEFTVRVRSKKEYNKTPILMVSSKKREEDMERGYQAGINKYIVKPLEGNRLVNAIKEYLY